MTLAELIESIQTRWPNAWPTKATAEAWARDYRNTVGRFAGKDLANAWQALINDWDKATWPRPADVKRYCERSGSRMTVAYAAPAADDFTRRCIQIEDDWLRENDDLTSQSRLEGWFMALRDWAREGANILAQRERNRARGLSPLPLGDRYPWLRADGEREYIIRPPAERVEMWRNAYAAKVPRGNVKVPA